MTRAWLFLALVPAAALAQSDVSGRVLLAGTPPAADPPAPGGCGPSKTESPWRVAPDGALAEAVVWVPGAPGKAVPSTVSLDVRTCAPTPRVQAAAVGSTLEIANREAVNHVLRGELDGTALFTVAMPLRGQVFRRRLDRPGWLVVTCDIHPSERAVVAVFAGAPFAVTGDDGGFVLHDVPAGEAEVSARHDGAVVGTTKLSAARPAAPVELRIAPVATKKP